jgi:hypothetical protein
MDGHLRAYKMDTGEVIWDFDAAREFFASKRNTHAWRRIQRNGSNGGRRNVIRELG